MKNKTDFFIPLHKKHPLFQSCIESIVEFYCPKNIYIATSISEIDKLKKCITSWKMNTTKFVFLEEENFFVNQYGFTKEYINDNWYTYKDDKSREFGWWYQQILKLGTVNVIPEISDPFIVWDSDLIPVKKWDIYPTDSFPFYRFALLQEKEKSLFNKLQYTESLSYLLKMDELFPKDDKEQNNEQQENVIGTFVPHHFVFHHKVIETFIKHVENIHKSEKNKTWIETIVTLSKDFYRFSEYKNIATFMSYYFDELLHYHSFKEYGEKGIRIRDTDEAQLYLKKISEKNSVSYTDFCDFVSKNYSDEDAPSYIQVEHL
jgi:hypothetical protein